MRCALPSARKGGLAKNRRRTAEERSKIASTIAKIRAPHGMSAGSESSFAPAPFARAAISSMFCSVVSRIENPWPKARPFPFLPSSWLIESSTVVFKLDPVLLAWLPTVLLAAVTLTLLSRAR